MNNSIVKQTESDLSWHTVCSTDDLIPNSGICALVNGIQVAVFYLPSTDEKVFAIDNYDPIGNANVLSRGIVGDLQGHLVVASPLYKQHFCLRDGHCLEQDISVSTYVTKIDGAHVQIAI